MQNRDLDGENEADSSDSFQWERRTSTGSRGTKRKLENRDLAIASAGSNFFGGKTKDRTMKIEDTKHKLETGASRPRNQLRIKTGSRLVFENLCRAKNSVAAVPVDFQKIQKNSEKFIKIRPNCV
jgi:hypothetical protein